MTKNQIEYNKLLENRRNNLRSEQLQMQKLNQDYEIQRGNLEESGRHNRATESLERGKARETGRHNLVSESVETGKLDELARSNLAREQNLSDKLQEEIRANQEKERMNRVQGYEAWRHNQAVESENYRANLAKEAETNRHNQRSEEIDWGRLGETTRSNLASEGIQIDIRRDNSLQRSIENELKTQSRLQDRDIARERQEEINRHDLVMEQISSQEANQKGTSTSGGFIRDIAGAASTIINLFK